MTDERRHQKYRLNLYLNYCEVNLNFWEASLKKRSRLDIYADILEYLKQHPDGCQVTRLSYAAGLPIDRMNLMLQTLSHFELVQVHLVGEPLQANRMQRRYYGISRKGLEYVEAYKKIQGLIPYLETEPRRPTGAPMDYLD
jgi:predicted transcriptional regulator